MYNTIDKYPNKKNPPLFSCFLLSDHASTSNNRVKRGKNPFAQTIIYPVNLAIATRRSEKIKREVHERPSST
jgi:hypothetical protein